MRDGEEISISRQTGVCTFSKAFEVVGGKSFVLDGQRALCQIDICCQLLEIGERQGVKLYLPEDKADAYTPDALVGKWGIFVVEEPMLPATKRSFLLTLKAEKILEKVSLYEFSFDFEVGGRKSNLYYFELNK